VFLLVASRNRAGWHAVLRVIGRYVGQANSAAPNQVLRRKQIMKQSIRRVTLPLRHSLRRRLPFVAFVLITVVLTVFVWVAFREVESALLEAGGARAQAAADQLVNLLSASTTQRARDLRRVAREPALRAFLENPHDDAAERARPLVATLTGVGQPSVEIWDTEGRLLLAVSSPADESAPRPAVIPPSTRPSTPGVQAFRAANGILYWEAVAEVRREIEVADVARASEPPALLGYVSSRRLLSNSSDTIARLVGTGAVIKIGNQGGDLWSDLAKIVPPPPVATSRPGIVHYRTADQAQRLGALAQITDTPWAVWVEFPRDQVVAPARGFLGRMSLFGLIFLAFATLTSRAMSERITRPLHELTNAAEAIAAGDLRQRVAIQRADEIGRLGAAFNLMAEQIGDVQRDLEARVAERTASLVRAEERTRTILRTAKDAFLGIDASGRIVDWNEQAAAIFGWPADEAIGRTLPETIIPEAHREAHQGRFDRYRRTAEVSTLSERLELVARRRNGEEFPVDATIWSSGTGDDVTFHALLRDITERKRADQEVRDARTEADRANRAKSEFLSLMSHDLRTPLNAILGFAQLLELDDLDESQIEYVQQILSGGRHLLELINEVLDITRVESGQLAISPEPVLVRDVVEHAVELVHPLAAQRHIAVTIASLGDHEAVQADRQRLSQILLNLLSNAVKYNTARGQVTVSGQRVSPDRYRIAVTDTGAGIPESKLSLLFKPFERLGAEQTAIEGTGLGLALSRSLAAAMGGALGVDSVVDRGSTFWVELSIAKHQAPSAWDHADSAPAPERATSAVILYIEDNQSNFRLMERVVSQRPGIELEHAPDGKAGLALAVSCRPDLVLLDMHLPDMSGEDVVQYLWADPRTRDIPVVVVTADASPGLARRLKAAGATSCVTKPINVRGVLELIDNLLNGQGRRELDAEPTAPSQASATRH